MKSKNVPAIKIDPDLYEKIRTYCDEKNIRLKYFVEEALESLVKKTELEERSEEIQHMLNQLSRECDKAYRHGFMKGIHTLFYSMQGKLGMAAVSGKPHKASGRIPFKIPEGTQLTLFDE